MKLIAFPIAKEKLNKRNIAITAAVVLLLAIGAGYVWLQRADRLPEFNVGAYLQRLAAGVGTLTQRGVQPAEQLAQEELEITLPAPAGGTYEQIAEQGNGITHLARKAAKAYLDKTGQAADLTAEHKVYIEDYLTKKTGDRWLDLGEKVSFSEDLIKEAVDSSRQLNAEQLDNLKQYSAQISSF
jgi:hypothetical protein